MYWDGYGYNQFGTERLDPAPSRDLGLGYRDVAALDGEITHWESRHFLRFVSEAEVRDPSDMLAFADVWGWLTIISLKESDVADYHGGGANGVFCDGHVEYGKRSKWIQRTESARKRWNNDNQPHPETWEIGR